MVAEALVVFAGVLHVLFFALESVLFMQPKVYGAFGLRSEDEAKVVRVFLLNQGFYNLFLAAGAISGVVFVHAGYPQSGVTLMVFTNLFMVGAGLVLFASVRSAFSAALLQAGPPAVALAIMAATML